VRYLPLSDLGGEHRAKPVPPKSDGLMADVDPALGQEILDVAQRQRVPDVHHHDQTDHFRRAVEISKRVAHGLKLPQPEAARKIGLTPPEPNAGVHPKAKPHCRDGRHRRKNGDRVHDALSNADTVLAHEVVAADVRLDALQREIEELAVLTIARRQPMTVNLRQLIGAIRVAGDLERVGDLAKNIAALW